MWRNLLLMGSIVTLTLVIFSGTALASGPTMISPALELSSTPSVSIFWYLSRTSAMVAYILLFFSICLGLGLKLRYLDRISKRRQTLDLHRLTSILALAFIGLHIFTLLGDGYFNFGLKELLVPFASPYQPVWTTLGVLSLYGVLAVTFTSRARKAIGEGAWRVIHRLSYPLFFAILVHGVRNGSDTSAIWAQGLYVGTGAILAFLLLRRFLASRFPEAERQEDGTTAKGQAETKLIDSDE